MPCNETVAVAVIAYNSSKTVVETLNSIISQTYGAKSIELIISDDASTDDTVSVIDDWLKEHGSVFHSVHFIKNVRNLGVPGNVNVAWNAAISKWVKTIAGDDILINTCICDNVDFLKGENDTFAVFSEMLHFKVNNTGENEIINTSPTKLIKPFFDLPASEQFKMLCIENFVPAPSSFLNLNVLQRVGYADEKFKLIEDYPLWLKLTDSGYRLRFLDKKTVFYRISNSLSSNVTRLVNLDFFADLNNVYMECIYPKIKSNSILTLRMKLTKKLTLLVVSAFRNKRNFFSTFMMRFIYLISPRHATIKYLVKCKVNRIFQSKIG